MQRRKSRRATHAISHAGYSIEQLEQRLLLTASISNPTADGFQTSLTLPSGAPNLHLRPCHRRRKYNQHIC